MRDPVQTNTMVSVFVELISTVPASQVVDSHDVIPHDEILLLHEILYGLSTFDIANTRKSAPPTQPIPSSPVSRPSSADTAVVRRLMSMPNKNYGGFGCT